MDPSALVVAIVTLPNSFPSISISPVKEVIILRSAVPACEAFIPLFAISPIASAVSSTL